MKKQTFEILPVSPEERKHLVGLSYNEIGDVLQEKDSLSLISYLNSNSVKIAEMAIITLNHREDFWNIVEEVLNRKLLKNRLAKICFLSGVYHFGKTDLGIKTSISFLNDKSLDVVGYALWGIVFYNDVKYIELVAETQKKYSQETEIYSRFTKAIQALTQGNPFLYSPGFLDRENVWQLDENLRKHL